MEKMILNNKEYEFKDCLPIEMKREMALFGADIMYIVDENIGIVVKKYDYDILFTLLILRYYGNVPVFEMTDEEQNVIIDEVYSTSDYLTTIYGIRYMDGKSVENMIKGIADIIKEKTVRENSLDYKIGVALKDVLNGEAIMKNIEKTSHIDEKLLDAVIKLDSLKDDSENKEDKVSLGKLLSFAKK